ncbi:metal-dependent hydrolase [Haloarchaeobius sp. HRN-SO-5]|uniref:metal-dependent hydrolase n=1 Tax=Haloarchaeobius sp. HRN-SO-5 TaxID=3446118 RepID=UPI003EB7EC01
MWPWEHVAVAYLLVSATCWLLRREPPSGAVAATVGVAAVLPDLVDKPLAWWLHVLPDGRSFAHSLLFAVPAVVAVLTLARRAGRDDVGIAFAVGYLSHLPLDVLSSGIGEDSFETRFLLWPVRRGEEGVPDSAVPHLLELHREFLAYLSSPAGRLYLAAELALLTVALAVWLRDGLPGPRWLVARVRPARRAE